MYGLQGHGGMYGQNTSTSVQNTHNAGNVYFCVCASARLCVCMCVCMCVQKGREAPVYTQQYATYRA